MSLFDKISTGLSQVSDLFSKPDASTNGALNETNKTAPTSFWANLFGQGSTPSLSQNAGLNNAARQINLSNEDIKAQNTREATRVNLGVQPQQGDYVQVPVVLPHNYPTPQQESRAILTALKFKDSDIQAYNEHYKTDLVQDLSVGLGKNFNHNAGRRVYVAGEKKDVYTGYIAIGARTHQNLKDFLAARRSGGELPAAPATKPATHTASQTLATVTVLAGGGAGLGATMIETMPPQVATNIVPQAMETLGKVAPLAADMAGPGAFILAEAAPTVLIADHAARNYMEAKGEYEQGVAARNYDAARDLAKATTATMTMDDAEPQMQPVPEAKPKDIPFAPPMPKPKATDLADAPTETTIAPVPKAKPRTKVDDLPQPVAPDVPKGTAPQVEPPNAPKNLDRIIPPIIIGTAASKAINNAMNQKNVAPNGVENIQKREWTPAEYQQWFGNLPTQSAKLNTPANIYQLIYAGDTEYTVSGGGVKFDADGIKDKEVLEAKFVGSPEKSPYIEDSKLPDFLRQKTDRDTRWEFERMSKILRDENNPLTSVRVITNNPKSVTYFEKLMREYKVPGEVVLETKTDIEQ